MNDQQLENKVRKDTAKVKKDLSVLVGDSTVQFDNFKDNVNQASDKTKEDITAWVEGGVSQLNEGLEKLTGDAREAVINVVESAKKDVGHGLSQYNARVQEVADKVPGSFGKKASRYPWVAISISLFVGFLLGSLLKTTRRFLG